MEKGLLALMRGRPFCLQNFQYLLLFCLTYLQKYDILISETREGGEINVRNKNKRELRIEIAASLITLITSLINLLIVILKGD